MINEHCPYQIKEQINKQYPIASLY